MATPIQTAVDIQTILVVDDNEMNRDVLSRRLEKQGYSIVTAENGRQALDLIRQNPQEYDLVLLDIMMPEMDGYQVLEHLNADHELRNIPVIVISSLQEIDSIVRCIQLGAEDYLSKPFDPTLLKARIGASLEKKRLRDQEQAYLEMLKIEQEKSERLLLNILPRPIAERLKEEEGTIADTFPEVTVLFADLVNFTEMSGRLSAGEVVNLLGDIFSRFDALADLYELEKIKTIGDSYMVVGGLPTPREDHAEAVARMALEMQRVISEFHTSAGESFQMRIGINTGPVVAGVIGTKKFIYDLWGDTVNMASRMESHGVPGAIQISSATFERLKDSFQFEGRGLIEVKGKGQTMAYLLIGENS